MIKKFLIAALTGVLPSGATFPSKLIIDPVKLANIWNAAYDVSLPRIGAIITDTPSWTPPLTPNDRWYEIIGSIAYRTGMSLLQADMNGVKGRFFGLKNVQNLRTVFNPLLTAASQGDVNAAKVILGMNQQVIGVWNYMNDVGVESAWALSRAVLPKEIGYTSTYMAGMTNLATIWALFEPDYYSTVTNAARTFITVRTDLINAYLANADPTNNVVVAQLLHEASLYASRSIPTSCPRGVRSLLRTTNSIARSVPTQLRMSTGPISPPDKPTGWPYQVNPIEQSLNDFSLKPGSPWGFVVYRVAYGNDTDSKWSRMLQLLEKNVEEYSVGDPVMEALRPRHQLVVMDDREKFEGMTPDDVRRHFRSWTADELEKWLVDPPNPEEMNKIRTGRKDSPWPFTVDIDLGTRYNICVYIDESCLDSLDRGQWPKPEVKLVWKDWKPQELPLNEMDVDDEMPPEIDIGWTILDVNAFTWIWQSAHARLFDRPAFWVVFITLAIITQGIAFWRLVYYKPHLHPAPPYNVTETVGLLTKYYELLRSMNYISPDSIAYPPYGENAINISLALHLGLDERVIETIQKMPYINLPTRVGDDLDEWATADRHIFWHDGHFVDYRNDDDLWQSRDPLNRQRLYQSTRSDMEEALTDSEALPKTAIPLSMIRNLYGMSLVLDTASNRVIVLDTQGMGCGYSDPFFKQFEWDKFPREYKVHDSFYGNEQCYARPAPDLLRDFIISTAALESGFVPGSVRSDPLYTPDLCPPKWEDWVRKLYEKSGWPDAEIMTNYLFPYGNLSTIIPLHPFSKFEASSFKQEMHELRNNISASFLMRGVMKRLFHWT
ncbi:hypothetical protein B7463_g11383, partial [Scytalidium lignicola]